MLTRLALFASSSPFKPEFWFDKAGAYAVWVVVAIIFAESGLFFGFFLPGDSLLFFLGFLTSSAAETGPFATLAAAITIPLPVILLLVFVAAVAGDQVGYVFGRKVGPALFKRDDSRFFKREYVERAHSFFEHHGSKSIFLARFVPIIRTFTPIVAGVSEMDYPTFLKWNVLGGLCWAVGVTLLGHFLGQVEMIRDNIDIAIIILVAISLTPMVIEFLRHRKHAKAASLAADASTFTDAANVTEPNTVPVADDQI